MPPEARVDAGVSPACPSLHNLIIGEAAPYPVLYQPEGLSRRPRRLGGEFPAPAGLKSIMATLRQQIATNVLTVTRFRELMRKLRENRPNDDLDLVKRAYEFSQKHHAGQSRASGEPYLVHPLEVGNVLADLGVSAVNSPLPLG